jgi:hypothetical protein
MIKEETCPLLGVGRLMSKISMELGIMDAIVL